jgi:hypothetical protein
VDTRAGLSAPLDKTDKTQFKRHHAALQLFLRGKPKHRQPVSFGDFEQARAAPAIHTAAKGQPKLQADVPTPQKTLSQHSKHTAYEQMPLPSAIASFCPHTP